MPKDNRVRTNARLWDINWNDSGKMGRNIDKLMKQKKANINSVGWQYMILMVVLAEC